MHPRIAFAKTGWSEEYNGDRVVGRHQYISTHRDAFERFNFRPGPDTRFYAYVPPIGMAEVPPKPSEKEDWLVIFIAARDGSGPLTIVGWYEHAAFPGTYLPRPEYGRSVSFPTSAQGQQFVYCISAPTAHLIPFGKRTRTVSGAHMRRTPVTYIRGEGRSDAWRDELAEMAERLVES